MKTVRKLSTSFFVKNARNKFPVKQPDIQNQ